MDGEGENKCRGGQMPWKHSLLQFICFGNGQNNSILYYIFRFCIIELCLYSLHVSRSLHFQPSLLPQTPLPALVSSPRVCMHLNLASEYGRELLYFDSLVPHYQFLFSPSFLWSISLVLTAPLLLSFPWTYS